MARDLNLSTERYIAALNRQRERIAGGLEFWAFDSTAPGAKETQASWGLCASDAGTWPEPADRLFPDEAGRHTPKYRNAPHKCPMDTREGPSVGGWGCFKTCRVFKGRIKAADRYRALQLYDQELAIAAKRSLA